MPDPIIFDHGTLLDTVVTYAVKTTSGVHLARGRVIGRRSVTTITSGKPVSDDVLVVETADAETTVDLTQLIADADVDALLKGTLADVRVPESRVERAAREDLDGAL